MPSWFLISCGYLITLVIGLTGRGVGVPLGLPAPIGAIGPIGLGLGVGFGVGVVRGI